MPGTRRRKRYRKASRLARLVRRFASPPVFYFLIIVFSAFAAYVVWLDVDLVTRLGDRQWSLPGRMYASPMDLHPAQAIEPATLEMDLRDRGYRQVRRPSQPGEYGRSADALEIFIRQFRYWDGTDSARRIRVAFREGAVVRIDDLDRGGGLALVRIEPPLIGRIYPASDEDRVFVPFPTIPPTLINAVVAVEDQRFFEHAGLDLFGIVRALWADLLRGEWVQGGSTLTQQLVKNLFLSRERIFSRKINEILMALLLERRLGKDQIIEAYINEVYLGQHGQRAIHGFGAAAVYYFDRPLDELSVGQLALLAGLVKGASYYNPRRYPERALARRNHVLDRMEQERYLDAKVVADARRRPLGISPQPGWTQAKYPAIIDAVRRQLQREYRAEELRSAGLRIFTTVDPALQEMTSAVTTATLARLERERNLPRGSLQVAAVLIRISNGDILAAVGGRSDGAGKFNRSLDARRPIGSLVKPFVFLSALSEPARYNVLTALDDSPLELEQGDGRTWRPRNYDAEFHGRVSVMEALAHSYNVATVRLGLELGLESVIDTLVRAGVVRPLPPHPSLLLGAVELSPVEVAQLYQSLANGGFASPLNGIREVVSDRGQPLRRYGLEMKPAFDPAAVYLTEFLLQRVTTEGTAYGLNATLGEAMPVAGKTGTTDDLRDSWFAGYGDGLLAVTWVGRDDNRPMGLTGAAGAMRVWADLMQGAGLRPLRSITPPRISFLENAKIPYRGACRDLKSIPFIEPYRPGESDGC